MDRSGGGDEAGAMELRGDDAGVAAEAAGSRPAASAEDIRSWLVEHLASLLDIPPHEVSLTSTFDEYGLDSAAAVAMTGELARWLKVDLDPNLVAEHRTIEAVAQRLAAPSPVRS